MVYLEIVASETAVVLPVCEMCAKLCQPKLLFICEAGTVLRHKNVTLPPSWLAFDSMDSKLIGKQGSRRSYAF